MIVGDLEAVVGAGFVVGAAFFAARWGTGGGWETRTGCAVGSWVF